MNQTGRKCFNGGKASFSSLSSAKKKRYRFKKAHGHLRLYKCPYCNKYHFTSRKDGNLA